MIYWLEALRVILSFCFLALSSWYDFKTREVSNKMWMLFAPLGFALSLLQFYLARDSSFLVFWLLSFLTTAGLSLGLFYLGFFGGADAKALISLSIALPIYPSSLCSHLNRSVFFPLAVLSNAVLGSSLLVIVIAIYNLFKLTQTGRRMFEGLESQPLWKKMIVFIIGFKIDVNRLKKDPHYIPLEYFSKGEDGKIVRRLRVSPRLDEETLQKDEHLDDFSKETNGKIWVTPGLPFLLFITAGFGAALIFGDLISWLTTHMIG